MRGPIWRSLLGMALAGATGAALLGVGAVRAAQAHAPGCAPGSPAVAAVVSPSPPDGRFNAILPDPKTVDPRFYAVLPDPRSIDPGFLLEGGARCDPQP